jgi:4-amino-4-deoxy-L-arabinose transferase-like glycosyltransferase
MDKPLLMPDRSLAISDAGKDVRILLALILIAIPLFYVTPFFRELWSPDEPRYAAIVKEMVLTGNWLVPHLNGLVYAEKPPLYFWLVAMNCRLWGNFSNAALLFPSLLAALGCLVVTYFFGRNLFNRATGFLSALVLATGAMFLGMAQYVRMDMLLTFFMASALFCFYEGWRRSTGKTIYYLAFYMLLALGFLTKGPIGILFPVIIVVLCLALKRDFKALREAKPVTGVVLIVLILAPWLIAATHDGGWEYMRSLLIRVNLGRAYQSWEHDRPPYYYLIQLPATMFPWFPFLVGAVAYHNPFRKQHRIKENVLFLFIWVGTIFLALSLVSAKVGVYLLPIMPPASLLIGHFWYEAIANKNHDARLKKWFSLSGYGVWLVFALAGAVILFGVRPGVIDLPDTSVSVILIGTSIAGLICWKLNREKLAFITIMASMALLLSYATIRLVPVMNAQASLYPLGKSLALLREQDEQVGMYNCDRPSCYFYTGSYITMLKSEAEVKSFLSTKKPTLCVLDEEDFNTMRTRLGNVNHLDNVEVGGRKLVIVSGNF